MKPLPAYFDLDDQARLDAFKQELDEVEEQPRRADRRKAAAPPKPANQVKSSPSKAA